jgi:hypothetical protein
MILKLQNNLTKITLTFNVKDLHSSNIFFDFKIRLKDNIEGIKLDEIRDGEYTYTLWDGDKQIAIGLVQIGDYIRENKEYKDNNKKTYKVYGE